MIQCERGHFFDENRFQSCPYCSQVSAAPRSVTPPVAPLNMAIPQPSCGKTVAIEGMETEPQIQKTVAIDNFEVDASPLNKTVAINESELPPVAPVMPVVASVPVAPSTAQVQAVPQSAANVPAAEVPVVPQTIATPVSVPATPEPQQIAPTMPQYPVTGLGVAEHPQPIAEEPETYYQSSDRPYAVTGLGVKENPQPIAKEAETYYQPSDRPYAVTGLGVKENPTPIPVDNGATFPIPGGAPSGTQPVQPEATAFAAFGFPGGPMPGMFPGGPMPCAPMPNMAAQGAPAMNVTEPSSPVSAPDLEEKAETVVSDQSEAFEVEIPKVEVPVIDIPVVEVPAFEIPEIEVVSNNQEAQVEPEAESETVADTVASEIPMAPVAETAVPEIPVAPVEKVIPEVTESEAVVEPVASEPVVVPIEEENPVSPADPNATVALTESEMDYTPRSHARAFFVCIDGPMTGASFVFRDDKAIIGRQMNYEISLFRDNSVSRNPHAVINYYTDSQRYTVSCGDSEKRVSVNGQFISEETELRLYDIVGIGQTRLLFIPVCSEKFAW